MDPSEGERRAVVGFSGQYGLAARLVYEQLPSIEWIHLADPNAGIADDFQFKAGPIRHALQVKWSQFPGSFTWGDLTSGGSGGTSLVGGLAAAWLKMRALWDGPLRIHLCTNGYASTSPTSAPHPLASGSAQGPRHFAAFLESSFAPVCATIRDTFLDSGAMRNLSEYVAWKPAWETLQTSTGLGEDDFFGFVRDLEVNFGMSGLEPSQASTLNGPAGVGTELDLRHLAATLQACVTDPSQQGRLDRANLLTRLGWSDRFAFRNRHEFPVPGTYAPNSIATEKLKSALEGVGGGYLALVGPAGAGKSTLLADLALEGRVIHYYAFVPDSPNPVGHRGEAEAFLSDLTLALEKSGLRRPSQPLGLPALRYCLEQQLARAQEAWEHRGERTVIILDGLDHVPREQNPQRSMLEELPSPSALGTGVFMLLGTQTTAVLGEPIRHALGDERRTVELPPLSESEVGEIAHQAGLDLSLSTPQLRSFVVATEGHPLATTYLLGELEALIASNPDGDDRTRLIDAALADAGQYGGEVERRYRGYFQGIRGDAEVLELVGVVARVRGSISLAWLAAWAEAEVVNRFVERTATLFRVGGDDWQFVHNSFRRFLADETATVNGTVSTVRDRELHSRLADLCASTGDAWPNYRDEEVAHRFMAGDDAAVLALVSPAKMRAKLLGLYPPKAVEEQTHLGLRAAARARADEALIGLTLFDAELGFRVQALGDDQLAKALAVIDDPASVVHHLVRGNTLRLVPKAAMEIAARWSAVGAIAPAAQVLNALGGVGNLVKEQSRFRKDSTGLADWATATLNVAGLQAVLGQVDRHLQGELPVSGESIIRVADEDHRDARLEILTSCFDERLDVRDFGAVEELTTRIANEGRVDWHARCFLMLARAAAADGDCDGSARWIEELVALDSAEAESDGVPHSLAANIRMGAAICLISVGAHDTDNMAALGVFDDLDQHARRSQEEFEALIADGYASRSIRAYLSLAAHSPSVEGSTASITVPPSPGSPAAHPATGRAIGLRRMEAAVDALSTLRAEAWAWKNGFGERPAVAGRADEILQTIEVPRRSTIDWTAWYQVPQSFPKLLDRLIDVAHLAGGTAELLRMAHAFDRAWTGARGEHWSVELRLGVLERLLEVEPSAKTWVQARLAEVVDLLEARPYDPESQVSAWLRFSELQSAVGDRSGALSSLSRAVLASAGVGQVDDSRQLAQWVPWLTRARAAGSMSDQEFLDAATRFAARVQNAARVDDSIARDAARELVTAVWAVSPTQAYGLADTLSDGGSLPELELLAAVLDGVSIASVSMDIALGVEIARELYIPASGRDSDGVIERLKARASQSQAEALDRAWDVWSIAESEDPPADSAVGSDSDREPPEVASVAMEAVPPNPSALLGVLRALKSTSDRGETWWARVEDEILAGAIAPNVAREIVRELLRLSARGRALGLACAALAAAGDSQSASESLRIRLASLPNGGWLRNYDGGTRFDIFSAALSRRDPALLDVARADVAASVASGVFRWNRIADAASTIFELVTGPTPVGGAWREVEEHLDAIARTDSTFKPRLPDASEVALGDTASSAMVMLLVDLLGHPTTVVELGARRTLITLLRSKELAEPVRAALYTRLQSALQRGGSEIESVLTVVLLGGVHRCPQSLLDAVETHAQSDNQINRDLARSVLASIGVMLPPPPARSLPVAYGIELPPLPIHKPPQVDAEGVPFIDFSDPQEVVAPYNDLLEMLAEAADLSSSAVIHRAAAFAQSTCGDRWTDGGHRAMGERLKARDQKHVYRPWAYKVGRRATGRVLAELIDAGMLDGNPDAYDVGLLAPELVAEAPAPLPADVVYPWRPEGTHAFSVSGWCDEATQAAEHYAQAMVAEQPFVLAEVAEWSSLEWGVPEERRATFPLRRFGSDLLGSPVWRRSVEDVGAARHYGAQGATRWQRRELVVSGLEQFSDAPFLNWIAFHPDAARDMGWIQSPGERGAWHGADGSWRVKSVWAHRGWPSHKPPAHTFLAELWRVVLSEEGVRDVEARFGVLRRRLAVTRYLPQNRREGSDAKRERVKVDF